MMKKEERLDKIIAMGRSKYIFFHGVLGWGLSTAILFSIIQYFREENFGASNIMMALITFPLMGIFWGAYMWKQFKKKHNEKMAEPVV